MTPANASTRSNRLADKGSPALAHCAGKGGVLAMTRQLAMEGAAHNIRANSICPGMTVTSATKPVLEASPQIREAARRPGNHGYKGAAWAASCGTICHVDRA